MSLESLPELPRSPVATTLPASTFSSFPKIRPFPHIVRSYSEIRKQMHLSLQARLNRDYLVRKASTLLSRSELSLQDNKKLWESLRKTSVSTALAQIKIDARLKKLAMRKRAEAALSTEKAQSQGPTPISRVDSLEPPKIPRPTPSVQHVAVVSVKEAMKDREWMFKNKDVLLKYLSSLFHESNGISLAFPEAGEPYRYFIKKGNNSKLINQLMKVRPWWTRVKAKSDANFVWSSKREMTYLALIPACNSRTTVKSESMRGVEPLVFQSKFCPPEGKGPRMVTLKPIGVHYITGSSSYIRLPPTAVLSPRDLKVHNRLASNFQLTHKKSLFINMKRYYEALGETYTDYIPLTFHISTGETDPEFISFVETFEAVQRDAPTEVSEATNLWIVKPGENSNQGRDITICSTIEQVRLELRSPVDPKTGQKRTFILQKYIDKPFLYHKRKFDIRCYAMVTCVNGVIQGYFYQEGYLRTSSKEFSLKHTWDKFTHLTNDAVQKTSEEYGKFENGNKVSFGEFQKYLDVYAPELRISLNDHILPQIKHLIQSTFKATFFKLDPDRHSPTFEILGYDFMLDWRLKPILIEVNTNPCLALVCPLLFRVIPAMVEGAIRLVVDALFPDWMGGTRKTYEPVGDNRWELIFHEFVDGKALYRLLQHRGTLSILSAPDQCSYISSDEDEDEGTVG